MEPIFNLITGNPLVAVALGAFLCGVALMYLVMQRTLKHRQNAESMMDQGQ